MSQTQQTSYSQPTPTTAPSPQKSSSQTHSQSPRLPFSILAQTFQKVGNCKGENCKNSQKAHLSLMFKTMIRESTDDLVRGYWLCILRIGPDYETKELGIGREMIVKLISKSCGLSEKQVREKHNQIGDFGEIAQTAKSTQKTMDSFFTSKKAKQPLTIQKFFNSIKTIASTKGNNSISIKQGILINLLTQANGVEIKFIIRWIQGNLKISAREKTMQKALITALYQQLVPYKQEKQKQQGMAQYQQILKKSVAEYPDYTKVIHQLVKLKDQYHKLPQLCKLTLFIPCRPMLAKPTKGITQILNRFEGKKFTCQYKYDGLRGQVHYCQGRLQIYSRNLELLTLAYVDIVEQFKLNNQAVEHAGLKSFILDCQVVAIDKKTGKLLPFQVLSTRSKKSSNINQIQVNVNLFAFDILNYNQPITHLPLRQRRQYLNKVQAIFANIVKISEHRQLQDFSTIDEFLQESIKGGTEGLMIKDLDSAYSCSKRSWDWVKLKKDYVSGLGDTLDVVPIAAFYGSGKRAGLFGSYLLAVYNSDMQKYQTLCKCFTGYTDQFLKTQTQKFKKLSVPSCPIDYSILPQMQKVDVWLPPTEVWEVKGADFQLSPVYSCGIGETNAGRGIGLRFPRFVRVRQDKGLTETSSNQFIYQLYKQQVVVQNNAAVRDDDDDDYQF